MSPEYLAFLDVLDRYEDARSAGRKEIHFDMPGNLGVTIMLMLRNVIGNETDLAFSEDDLTIKVLPSAA